MSWDSYIDNLIGQSADANGEHHADKACIIGIDGSMWTSDGHPHSLKLSAEEAAAIGACFSSKNFTSFMSSGVFLEGKKQTTGYLSYHPPSITCLRIQSQSTIVKQLQHLNLKVFQHSNFEL